MVIINECVFIVYMYVQWEPSNLEKVHDAIVMQFSEVVHDDRWGYLELPQRQVFKTSKL